MAARNTKRSISMILRKNRGLWTVYFRCSAVQVSRLKMSSNEFNSLRKTFDIKIMTFPPALETLGRNCMKETLIKSRNPWKSKRFQITRDIAFVSLKRFLSCYEHERCTRRFLSLFIQRYLRHPIFCFTFCGNFWKSRKNIPILENDLRRLFKIIFQSVFNLHSCARHTNLHKYKSGFDSSKGRLDTTILCHVNLQLSQKLQLLRILNLVARMKFLVFPGKWAKLIN